MPHGIRHILDRKEVRGVSDRVRGDRQSRVCYFVDALGSCIDRDDKAFVGLVRTEMCIAIVVHSEGPDVRQPGPGAVHLSAAVKQVRDYRVAVSLDAATSALDNSL